MGGGGAVNFDGFGNTHFEKEEKDFYIISYPVFVSKGQDLLHVVSISAIRGGAQQLSFDGNTV